MCIRDSINLIKGAFPTFNTDTGTVAAWTLGQGIGALDGLLD